MITTFPGFAEHEKDTNWLSGFSGPKDSALLVTDVDWQYKAGRRAVPKPRGADSIGSLTGVDRIEQLGQFRI